MRKCDKCDFSTDLGDAAKDLIAMADHLTLHNPSPAQWTEAYQKIVQGRERAKKREKEQNG